MAYKRATSVAGWNFVRADAAAHEWQGVLVRVRDYASIVASADPRNWTAQIDQFEFFEGAQWPPVLVPAVKCTDKPVSVGMDLASGPDRTAWASVRLPDNVPQMRPGALRPSVPGGVLRDALTAKAAGMPTYYDTIPTSGKTMHSALLRILGDMPRPDEDPYERCRAIASEALGYQKPEPMQLAGRLPGGQSMRKRGLYSYEDAAGQTWRRMEDSVENDAHDMCVDSLRRERDAAIAAKDAGVPTYYDIGWDERRPVTQEIVDIWESGTKRLIGEQNEALVTIECLQQSVRAVTDNYATARDARTMLLTELAKKNGEIALLRQALAAKDARIGELKSVLACTPVAFEDPDAKPVPAPGFLTAIRRGNKAVIGMVTGRGDMPSPIT